MISYKCKPGKWLWGIIPLALPFLGAWYLNSPIMVSKISKVAVQSLKSGGFEDLKLTMDGRDAVLGGQVESQKAIDQAVKSVLGIHGVRRVDAANIRIVKPVVLDLPTINPVTGNNNKPELTGTWPQGLANTLSVKLGQKTYVLGTDKELTSDGKGNWALKPASPLADGVHDIAVLITDSKKAFASDDSNNEVSIDTTAPEAPTIAGKLVTKTTQPIITGTWANNDAQSLTVVLGKKAYTLGKDKALSVDGKGRWALTPASPLADGVYDLAVKSADKPGNVSTTTLFGALTIDTSAPQTGSVLVSQGSDPRPVIKGNWQNADANRLSVTVDGKKYSLGKDKNLTSDAQGNWSLALEKPLAAGKHAVTVTSADALGNESSMTAPGVVVIDKTAPAAPVITSAINATTAPVFKGTWAEKAGNTLKVVIAGKIFALGRDKQLTSDGTGNWTLTLTQPLSDGKYAILAESSDAFGNLARSEKSAIVTVNTAKPDQPTVKSAITGAQKPQITGTWPQSDKNSLSVAFNGKTYVFGKDAQLTSDGKGNWTLRPVGPLIAAGADSQSGGRYDVAVTVTDQAGKSSTINAAKAINVDATPPQSPTVTTVLTRERTPVITGSWDSSDSSDLTVSVGGQSFRKAHPGEIDINGDHWAVKPRTDLADGTYDVIASVADKFGNKATDAGKAELVIDATPPAIPTVRPVFGTSKRPPVGGVWPEDGLNSLSVTLDGKSYTPTKGGALSSDGKGNWQLKLDDDLQPGSYDVKVKVADRLGNQSNDTSNGEIWVKAENIPEPATPAKPAEPTAPTAPSTPTAPATPAAPVAPVGGGQAPDCQAEFTAALAGQSIGFKTNKAQIAPASLKLIARLADIAKACPSAKIEISGHTDFRGSASFNQSLSEARASSVVDALVSRGVAKSRLRAVGYGEQRPIADNRTKQGQAKNRRIEFTVQQ